MTETTKPESVAETLRAARALIADPKHWTKGAMAKRTKRSADENNVNPDSPDAGAWCAVGAIKRVDGPYESKALVALAEAIDGSGNSYAYGANTAQSDIIDFNDTRLRRHREVLAKFDRAIALAEAAS